MPVRFKFIKTNPVTGEPKVYFEEVFNVGVYRDTLEIEVVKEDWETNVCITSPKGESVKVTRDYEPLN